MYPQFERFFTPQVLVHFIQHCGVTQYRDGLDWIARSITSGAFQHLTTKVFTDLVLAYKSMPGVTVCCRSSLLLEGFLVCNTTISDYVF